MRLLITLGYELITAVELDMWKVDYVNLIYYTIIVLMMIFDVEAPAIINFIYLNTKWTQFLKL